MELMETVLIDKSLLQSHKQCARRAWLEAAGTVLPQRSASAQAVLSEGEVVHRAARRKFAHAQRIGTMTLRDAADATARALQGGAQGLLEAAFVGGRLGVRADALVREGDSWVMTEFKSGSGVKDEHLDDCAIQYEAMRQAGMKVDMVRVCHPDTSLVMEDATRPESVLVTEDVTEAVKARAERVVMWLSECLGTLSGDEPDIKPGKQCSDPYDCPFKHHCGDVAEQKRPDDPQNLPSHAGVIKDLIASGVDSILEMPAEAFSHERNKLVRDALLSGSAVVRQAFAKTMRGFAYPRAFMDFEAASMAIPRFPGMRPYQAVTFQWSVHSVEAPGAGPVHSEFIDLSGDDPRLGFATSLLAATRAAKCVFVYSSYEKGRLKELAEALPELAGEIEALIERLIDLLPLARRGYYHPKMCGSWSIKKVLPTLPAKEGVTYEELDGIADGMAAQAAYIEVTNATAVGEQRETREKELRAYCKVDTAGLLHFAECVEAHA